MSRQVRMVGSAVALAALLLAAGTARPETADDAHAGPMERILRTTDQILAVLKDPALKVPEKKAERRAKVLALIDARFNWTDIAQRTLATYWAPRTPEERKEFIDLFKDLLKRTYMSKIEGYAGEKIIYKGERIEGSYARVDVIIVSTKGVDIPVQYSMKKYDAGGWLIYDIAIEGVKLVNNYRTQFSSMLNSMAYPQFVEKLKAKVAETKDE